MGYYLFTQWSEISGRFFRLVGNVKQTRWNNIMQTSNLVLTRNRHPKGKRQLNTYDLNSIWSGRWSHDLKRDRVLVQIIYGYCTNIEENFSGQYIHIILHELASGIWYTANYNIPLYKSNNPFSVYYKIVQSVTIRR